MLILFYLRTKKAGLGMRTGKHTDITEKIIKAFYTVYNTLGYGFSEKVYHLALVIEL